jgi:hypothetical protein
MSWYCAVAARTLSTSGERFGRGADSEDTESAIAAAGSANARAINAVVLIGCERRPFFAADMLPCEPRIELLKLKFMVVFLRQPYRRHVVGLRIEISDKANAHDSRAHGDLLGVR